MNWEVRTMQSKTSYFNGTLFRKNLTRFWPLWGGASFLGALFPLAMWMNISRSLHSYLREPLEFTNLYYNTLVGLPVVSLLYAILCAMVVWSYLYNARSVGMLHTLPLRREGLFLTNFLSGIAMMLIPYAVTGALCVLISLLYGSFDPAGLFNTILGVLGLSFFYFASATFAAFVTGNLFALPALYFLFHFLAVLLEWILSEFASCFLVGVRSYYNGATSFLSPTVHLLSHLGVDSTYEEAERITSAGTHYTDSVMTAVELENFYLIGVYALVGAALAAAAFVLYRRRRSECAGDVVAVGWMKPLFRYGLAALSALLGGRLLYALFWEGGFQNGPYAEALPMAVCMTVAGVIGYFAATMLLAKSLRVFRRRSWLGAGAVVLACAALCAVLRFDALGIQRRIPAAEELRSVYLYAGGNSYSLQAGKDDDMIRQVLDLHRAVAADTEYLRSGADPDDVYHAYTELTYTLADGKTLDRYYRLPITEERLAQAGTYDSLLDQFVNSTAAKIRRLHLDDDYAVTGGTITVYDLAGKEDSYFDLNSREAKTILDAVGRDAQAGTWGQVDLTGSDRDDAYAMDLYLSFAKEGPDVDRDADRITIAVRPGMENTLDCLDAMGLVRRERLLTWSQYYNDEGWSEEYDEMGTYTETASGTGGAGGIGIIGGADGPTKVYVAGTVI